MHFTNVKNAVSSESLHCYPAKGESAQARPPAPQKAPPRNGGGGILGIFFGGKTGIHKNPYILVCYLVLRVFWGNFGDAFLNFGEFWGCRLFSQKIIIFRIVT